MFEIALEENAILIINSALQWKRSNWRWITQYSGAEDSSADFISANGILLGGPTALEKGRVITETGGNRGTDFPHGRSSFVLCSQRVQRDSGPAEPCSLTSR